MDNNSNNASYVHKKFSTQKRKRSQLDDDDEVVFVMEQPSPVAATTQPAAKRHQPMSFFRPWLDQPRVFVEPTGQPGGKAVHSPQYHANMVRSHAPRQRSPKEQQRRDRNTVASLLNRRAQQAQHAHMEQQYAQYQAQHAAILEQQVRLSLYYVRCLQQAAATQSPLLPMRQQVQQKRWQQQLATTTTRP